VKVPTWRQVGYQLHLIGRSARDVARQPRLGRDLGRLLATRGQSTSRLRLPWLPFRLIDELSRFLEPRSRVFEFGGGGSTLWFLDQGCEVVTVEHVGSWSRRLAALVTSDRWELLDRATDGGFDDYVDAISDFPEASFDVVVVDGRERVRCALAALSRVRPGGWLIVDDVDRLRYAEGLATIPWPRRDIVGFAPAKPSLAHTAVFMRPVVDD
jgi:hypothetical protein